MLLMNRTCTVFPFLCSETHRTKILLPSYLSLNIPILHYMRLQETFYRANLSMLHFKYSSILQFKSCLLSNKTWIALSPVKWLSAGGVKKIGNHFKFWTKGAKSRKWLQAHKGYFVKGGKCTWGNTAAKRLRMRQLEHFRSLFQSHFPVRSKSPARS